MCGFRARLISATSSPERGKGSLGLNRGSDRVAAVRSSIPVCPDGPPAMSMSRRMGTIYPGAPGATGRQARARSLAEHATANTTEEANDRCRTPDDSTAEEKHSNHNRTNLTPRQAPAWAPFTFQGLSCELRHAAHGRFVKARPARPTSTRLRSPRERKSPSDNSNRCADEKAHGAARGACAVPHGKIWHAQPNAPSPRATGAATNG